MTRTRTTVFAALASIAATWPLFATFADPRWAPSTFGAVLVVALTGELARRLTLPVLLTPLLAVLALTGYVTAVFAGDVALYRVIPGGDAIGALSGLLHDGFADVATLGAPVPTHRGLVLFAVLGAATVAILVDLLAAGLHRASLAGLPMLALFAVPAAVVPHGVGIWPFVMGAAGYLALLLDEGRDRVGRWGRPLSRGRTTRSDAPTIRREYAETSPLAQVGRRIGAAAVGAAVVVPLLVPGLHPGLLGASSGSGLGNGKGASTISTYNPITKLKRDLTQSKPQTLFTYETDDPSPGYLRMATLDTFNGQTWSQSELRAKTDQRVSKGLPTPPGLSSAVPGREVHTKISVTDSFKVNWLPVPYPPVAVDVPGDWRYEPAGWTIFSTRRDTRGLDYSVTSQHLRPTPEELRDAPSPDPSVLGYTALDPRVVPQALYDVAARVTSGADSALDKAVAIQDFFRENFTYSLDVRDGNSGDYLENFLLHDRRGYCEQFSAAMALMARAVGIPARVDIGFTAGKQQSDGSYLVTTHEAHAWPELWFAGVGWVPFEPTPRDDGQTAAPAYAIPPGAQGPDVPGQTQPTPAARPSASATLPSRLEQDAQDQLGGKLAAPHSRNRGVPPLVVLLAVMVLLALASPSVGRWVTRRRRWAAAETPAARAHAGWVELRDDACDLGLAWPASETPRSVAARLGRGLGGAAETALGELARAEERARYATSLEAVGNLRAAEAVVRRALAARVPLGRRLRARVLPASTLQAWASAAGTAVADLLDWLDGSAARLSAVLSSRRAPRAAAASAPPPAP